jgi:radical SAM superfamily enzyme YgiQ (UPF0313 family)
MDGDDESVFERTVDWAIEHGIETATFHILTPYPGTALYRRLSEQGRLTVHDWDLYDTRHTVFRPAHLPADQLERGYHWAYREFYRWRSIARGAAAHEEWIAGRRYNAAGPGNDSQRVRPPFVRRRAAAAHSIDTGDTRGSVGHGPAADTALSLLT